MFSKFAYILPLIALLLSYACGADETKDSDGDSDTAEIEEQEDSENANDGDAEDSQEYDAEDDTEESDHEPVEEESETGEELPDSDSLELRGECAQAQRYGFFEIQNGVDFGSVSGKVADGVVPMAIQDEVLSEGHCRLLKRRSLFCDPPCESSHTCDRDGQCIPFPRNQNAGTFVVDGLTLPVSMSALPPGNNYSYNDVDNPPFEAGKTVRLRGGEALPGFEALYGVGVEPLETEDKLWIIERDAALSMKWSAPENGTHSNILLIINVDQHGNTPVTLRCELDDSGSAEIAAEMVNALLDSGISGYPNGRLIRRSADSVQLDNGACVELLLTSPREIKVRVKGYIPCDKDGDCPENQHCNMVSHLCE